MKSYKAFPFLTLLACISLCSCYHEFSTGSGGGGGGGGTTTNKVSFVLVADTPPANLGLISFRVNISSITLTSTSGTQTTLTVNGGSGLTVDLVRLQSDSAFLGTLASMPTGGITSITVSFSNPQLAFFNGTGAAITNLNPQCLAGAVCTVTFPTVGAPVITTSATINGNTGFGIDFNLANALTLTGTSLTLDLTNSTTTQVVTAFTLPRTNSNLATSQLDLIEDFTGVVSLSNSSVTIASNSTVGRGSITATANSSTVLDADPSGTLCKTPTAGSASTCVSNNQVASMDAILNSDGTLTAQEIEPLLATPVVDTVEGTIASINANNQTQFSLIATDLFPAATSSLIGGLHLGDPLTVNLANNVNPFLVDTKGLPVASQFAGNFGNFSGAINTAALHVGQAVAVHITSFTAASGTTAASSNTDTVTLRWSRFISTVSIASSPAFTVTALPGYFGFTQAVTFQIQTFGGTQGTDGVTNLDGVTSSGNLIQANPVGVRALFIEDAGNTLNPAFYAAKVRQQ
jgi:predicted regulator of Ras-like GTPase activity (Roadblock/LC7/MglB family)